MFHVTARHWDLEHSCNTDSRIMLSSRKRVFENKFVKSLNTLVEMFTKKIIIFMYQIIDTGLCFQAQDCTVSVMMKVSL